MIVTEEEAADKICPQRIGHHVEPPIEYARCLGSRCMAWVWTDMGDDEKASEPIYGYCGLAGGQ